MKVKTKVLSGFLNKTTMEGAQKIDEALLDFGKDGLKINANSPAQQVRISSWLKKAAFKEYEEFGKVGLNEIATVIRVLDRFGEFVTITKEGNLLTVKGDKKKVDIELTAEEFLKTDTGDPNLEFEDTFSIASVKLKEIIKDVEVNKDASLSIKTEDKKVQFLNTGKYKFVNEMEALTCKGGVEVTFGNPLIEATRHLDGVLQFSVKTDYPGKIMETTETSVITLIVAPRVEEE